MFGVILFRRLRNPATINGVLISNSMRFLSSEKDQLHKDHSFTVSYLVSSCGLSPESAIVASKKVRLRNPENPDSVLAFFREHQLSNAQISNLVRKCPHYLLADPAKSFLPKFEFLYSKGMSKETTAEVISSNVYILKKSLTNSIVPIFDLLKSISASDKQVVAALNRWHFSYVNNRENVISNIRLLKGLGISNTRIVSALVNLLSVMILKPERLTEVVKKVTDMGFDPNRSTFVFALRTFSMPCYEKRWRENFKLYEKWGWSESVILNAYMYFPNCMSNSEKKIDNVMDYLVNVMGLNAKEVAKTPVILCYSLEKRIRPRCSVIRVLLRKELVERGDFSLYGVVQITEKKFLAKYVTKYEKEVPLLMNVYQGKVHVDDA